MPAVPSVSSMGSRSTSGVSLSTPGRIRTFDFCLRRQADASALTGPGPASHAGSRSLHHRLRHAPFRHVSAGLWQRHGPTAETPSRRTPSTTTGARWEPGARRSYINVTHHRTRRVGYAGKTKSFTVLPGGGGWPTCRSCGSTLYPQRFESSKRSTTSRRCPRAAIPTDSKGSKASAHPATGPRPRERAARGKGGSPSMARTRRTTPGAQCKENRFYRNDGEVRWPGGSDGRWWSA